MYLRRRLPSFAASKLGRRPSSGVIRATANGLHKPYTEFLFSWLRLHVAPFGGSFASLLLQHESFWKSDTEALPCPAPQCSSFCKITLWGYEAKSINITSSSDVPFGQRPSPVRANIAAGHEATYPWLSFPHVADSSWTNHSITTCCAACLVESQAYYSTWPADLREFGKYPFHWVGTGIGLELVGRRWKSHYTLMAYDYPHRSPNKASGVSLPARPRGSSRR